MAKDRLRYAKKFHHNLLKQDFSELQSFSTAKQNHILKALSGLSKFLGMYDEFKRLVKAYGLKWQTTNVEDLIISRITNAKGNNVFEWVQKVKTEMPLLRTFLKFVLVSGLRFEEALNAYNLIIDLTKQGRLQEYYDVESEVLEHFRFKHIFMRRTKKVFISFIPNDLIETITGQEKLTYYLIINRIKRRGFKRRFSDIREYFATYMTQWLRQPEIDFLQGRVSGSVFMRNYFNPALIGDLRERVFKGIEEMENLRKDYS